MLVEWLEGLKGGAPTAVGAIIGFVLGFITLVLGALFNAHLSRVRDDNFRAIETRSLAAALRAELASIHDTLTDNASRLVKEPPTQSEAFLLPDLSHSVHVYPEVTGKIGLLGDPAVIKEVIQAYIVVDQYYEHCLVMGAEPRPQMPNNRRVLLMPSKRAPTVAEMNKQIAARVETAMNLLNKYLI
jgi:hypothetical protein